MQKANTFLATIGLCERAGSCLVGESACLSGVREEKATLLFLDQNSSGNTQKRFKNACSFHQVPLLLFDSNAWDIASAIGRSGSKIIAITDPSWGERLQEQAMKFHVAKSIQGGTE